MFTNKRITQLETRIDFLEKLVATISIKTGVAGDLIQGAMDELIEKSDTPPQVKKQKKAKCPFCGKVCANNTGLASHIRGHKRADGNNPSQKRRKKPLHRKECPVCHKEYKGNPGLAIHMSRAHGKKMDTESSPGTAYLNEQFPTFRS